MSENLPPCPQCNSEYTYELGDLLVCPECAHEWNPTETETSENWGETGPKVVKDVSGNELQDGDTVTIAKDLKVKGASTSIKVGTKVRNIRLVNGADGHDIEAKVDGFGQMMLKSSVVKKVL
jgi:protein PhnA